MSGALGLTGWIVDSPALKSLGQSVPINPATAVCFVLCGAALWLLRGSRGPARWAAVARGVAVAVACLGALKLTDLCLGWESGVDKVLFASRLAGTRIAGLPGPHLLTGGRVHGRQRVWHRHALDDLGLFVKLPVHPAPSPRPFSAPL